MTLFASNAVLQRSLRDDGAELLSSAVAIPDVLPDVLERLRFWAEAKADGPLLTQAGKKGGRETITYADALGRARQLRAVLADRGIGKGDVIASLVPAGIDALVLRIACLVGGYV